RQPFGSRYRARSARRVVAEDRNGAGVGDDVPLSIAMLLTGQNREHRDGCSGETRTMRLFAPLKRPAWRETTARMLIVASVWTVTAMAADVAPAVPLGSNPERTCAGLINEIPASAIGVPSGSAVIDSAAIVPAAVFAVAERAQTQGARITPATPSFCKVLGHSKPIAPKAPNINFQVNLPLDWNGRALQYGGGGFNGVLITGLGLPPAHPFDRPSPFAQGFVTYGTDSGHQ